MTEDAAKAWIEARYGTDRMTALSRFLVSVVDENTRQNLIAPSTIANIWQRHALDSAQLLAFDRAGDTWLDIGTGGGFPGMVVAILRDAPVVMIEPRAKRATFLNRCVTDLGLRCATVVASKVERYDQCVGIISARAVASIDALFESAIQCAGPSTRWILPKGRTAATDVDQVRCAWRGMFHVEHSIVEAGSGIIVAEGLRRR